MNDLLHASTLLVIYALALGMYGAILARSGNKRLLPLRAQHSIRNAEEVKGIGRIVVVVALVFAGIALVMRLVSKL